MSEDTRASGVAIAEEVRDAIPKELVFLKEDIPTIDSEQEKPVMKVSSAGYVYIWDTRTFEKIPVLYYMLSAKLRQRRPDGSYRFTTKKPDGEPWRGTIKCLLHSDGPDRKLYDSLGFRVCSKANITNPYQRTRHMQMKHGKEFAAIELSRQEKERLEDRELQRAILQRMTREEVPETAPLYISDKDRKLNKK